MSQEEILKKKAELEKLGFIASDWNIQKEKTGTCVLCASCGNGCGADG